jgi:hypothetical protein
LLLNEATAGALSNNPASTCPQSSFDIACGACTFNSWFLGGSTPFSLGLLSKSSIIGSARAQDGTSVAEIAQAITMPIEWKGNSPTRARFSLKESEIRANQPQILSKIIHFEQIAA